MIDQLQVGLISGPPVSRPSVGRPNCAPWCTKFMGPKEKKEEGVTFGVSYAGGNLSCGHHLVSRLHGTSVRRIPNLFTECICLCNLCQRGRYYRSSSAESRWSPVLPRGARTVEVASWDGRSFVELLFHSLGDWTTTSLMCDNTGASSSVSIKQC